MLHIKPEYPQNQRKYKRYKNNTKWNIKTLQSSDENNMNSSGKFEKKEENNLCSIEN